MEIGFVGLGKMGGNMVERLTRGGEHSVVAYDQSAEAGKQVAGARVRIASSLAEMAGMLQPPRAVWLMVPAGDPVDQSIASLAPSLKPGDMIIDGGNSYFRDSQRRAQSLQHEGISFLDAGTSGGIWGLQEGYCLMIGGEAEACRRLEPIFHTLAPPNGYLRVGESG